MAIFWIGFGIVLIGIALVGGYLLFRYLKDIRAARQRLDSLGSQVIETDLGPIEYARIGDGYPVLVVHGAMGGFDQGLWLAHSFQPIQYTRSFPFHASVICARLCRQAPTSTCRRMPLPACWMP